MLHPEVHFVELAIQPTQRPEFPLTYSQCAIHKHEKLVAKFQLRQTEYDLLW